MNQSSAASSSANPIRQGEKRKRESKPQPLPQNINNGSATRARIVEILASTANGCLAELGYFPGMPARLKDLENQNEKWREENVKLYQDNQRLVELTRKQNATLALSQIPDLDKLQRIVDLESQVGKLIPENDELRKLYQKYIKLHQDHVKLVDLYRKAYDEVHRLGGLLQAVAVQNQPPVPQMTQVQNGQQAAYAPQRLQSHSIPHSQRPVVPQIQTQQHHLAQVRQVQGQQQMVPSPVGISPLQTQFTQKLANNGQGTDLAQTQTAIMQNRRQQNSNAAPRRSSLNIVSPSMYQGPVQGGNPTFNPGPQLQPRQVQQQPQYAPNHAALRQDAVLPDGVRQIRRSSHPSSLSHQTPNGSPHSVPRTAQLYPDAGGSNPSTPDSYTPVGYPYPGFQTAPVYTTPGFTPAGVAPSPTAAPSPDIPPPPLSALSILAQNSLFAPPAPLPPSEQVYSSSPPQPSQPMTISPNDTYINPPGANQAQAISVTTTPSPSYLLPRQPETPVQNGGQSGVSNPIPHPHPTPYPSVDVPSAVNGTAAPPVQSPSINNENPSFSIEPTATADEPQEPPETPHVDEPGPEQHMHGPSHSAEPAPEPEPEPSAPEDENAMQVDAAEDGEQSEEEEVELGPDGLRLVRDCLDQIFEEPIDGEVICKLCEHRYRTNLITERPVLVVNATDEQLEAHCIEEHQYAWQALRNS